MKNNDSLTKWLRIIKNLTLNTRIDTLETYHRAVDGINKLTDNWDDRVKKTILRC